MYIDKLEYGAHEVILKVDFFTFSIDAEKVFLFSKVTANGMRKTVKLQKTGCTNASLQVYVKTNYNFM